MRVRARSGAERHPEDFMSSSRAKLGAGRGKAAVALTIAGSDSGGGAGIQADLKTFEAFGVFGTCAVTCVTAQNPDRVAAVEPISPRIVREQIRAVCSAFPVAAAKTGMLYSAAIIREVAGEIRRNTVPWLVVDPVMISTSGARLLRKDAMRALLDCLAPACHESGSQAPIIARPCHLRYPQRKRSRLPRAVTSLILGFYYGRTEKPKPCWKTMCRKATWRGRSCRSL